MKHLVVFVFSLALTGLLGFIIYLIDEQALAFLIREDGWIETAAALAFFTAFVLGLVGFVRTSPRRWILLIYAGVALLACLDEISFGERIFGFTPPQFRGKKIDGAHDLLDVFVGHYKVWANEHSQFVPVVFLGLGVAAAAGVFFFRRALRDGGVRLVRSESGLLAICCVALVALAQGIDVFGGHAVVVVAMEEFCEFAAGVALALACYVKPPPLQSA